MKKIFVLFLFIFIITACTSKKNQFIEDFGVFVNETEANYENYSEDEWKATELEYLNYQSEKKKFKTEFDSLEAKQIRTFETRFKNVKIRRDPFNNLLDIIFD